MIADKPTRREVLSGVAAASVLPIASLEADSAASALCFTSAVEMAQLIRAKKLSAREALAEHLKQIERVNPKVNAIVTLVADMATEAAARPTRCKRAAKGLGPLHGLPVAHKDLIETRGIRTTFGSPLFKDHVPTEDDLVVERMRLAGAIIIGKTNTPEFGAGSQTFNTVFGATRNPYDLTKTCGGSSGGAAVALACGMVPVASGSDAGGSLRNPAAFCNVVGFRPSIGRVPNPKAGIRLVHAQHLGMPGPLRRRPRSRAEHHRRPRPQHAARHQRARRSVRPPARSQLQRCARCLVQRPWRRTFRSSRPRRRRRASRHVRISRLHRRTGRA